MADYRKKPVVIQAVQLTDAVLDADHPSDLHMPGVVYDPMRREARIETLEGTMTASLGDWIIRGVKGEYYPCKPDIFEATYEPAAAPSSTVPKRYQITASLEYQGPDGFQEPAACLNFYEDIAGIWVKWKDVEGRLSATGEKIK